jgi:hypothetical protein
MATRRSELAFTKFLNPRHGAQQFPPLSPTNFYDSFKSFFTLETKKLKQAKFQTTLHF